MVNNVGSEGGDAAPPGSTPASNRHQESDGSVIDPALMGDETVDVDQLRQAYDDSCRRVAVLQSSLFDLEEAYKSLSEETANLKNARAEEDRRNFDTRQSVDREVILLRKEVETRSEDLRKVLDLVSAYKIEAQNAQKGLRDQLTRQEEDIWILTERLAAKQVRSAVKLGGGKATFPAKSEEVAELRRRIQSQSAALAALRSSRSWRLTAPLRRFTKLFSQDRR